MVRPTYFVPVPLMVRIGAAMAPLPPLYPSLCTVSCCVVCPRELGANCTLIAQDAAGFRATPLPSVVLPRVVSTKLCPPAEIEKALAATNVLLSKVSKWDDVLVGETTVMVLS